MSHTTDTLPIDITKTKQSRIGNFDFNNIQFGRVFSDHQYFIDYVNGEWVNPQIVPYGEVPMSMAISAIHYGQSIFEGMKAFKDAEGNPQFFRPLENLKRLNTSAARMCMPELPEELFMDALRTLIDLDKDWIPTKEGSALYIRPFMFATDAFIGVRPSESYRFSIFTCPVNAYYNHPLKVKVEQHYARAFDGGVGFAKCSGNYASAMLATKIAQQEGYSQILWTDALEHKYLEETGTTNVFVKIGDKILTPELDGTILAGITRDSVITLLKQWGVTVEERKVSIDELVEAYNNGTLKEVFATGTAATIIPIVQIHYKDLNMELHEPEKWEFSNKLSHTLDGIKTGKIADTFGWVEKL